jgi:hypothetical protein
VKEAQRVVKEGRDIGHPFGVMLVAQPTGAILQSGGHPGVGARVRPRPRSS